MSICSRCFPQVHLKKNKKTKKPSRHTGTLWQRHVWARTPTHHPSGSRWSPPCAPPTQAPPGTPGWWPPCRWGHRGGSRRCTASAWCPVWRSQSSRRSRRCSRWWHSSPPWHWLSQISGLCEKRKVWILYVCMYVCMYDVGPHGVSSQIKKNNQWSS